MFLIFSQNSLESTWLRNSFLIKFIGRHLCENLFFDRLQACNFIKKRLPHRCFPVNFSKFLRTPFLCRAPSMIADVVLHLIPIAMIMDVLDSYFNAFHVIGLFLYPLKTLENLGFWFYRGYRNMLFVHVGKLWNSRSQMFFKTGVLKNFAIFTEKILYWSLFLIKLLDWRPAFLLKKRLPRFPVNIGKFLSKNSFFIEYLFIIVFRNFIWWQYYVF